MQKPYVFISYSTIDQEFANKVNQTLKANGINTWIATEDIHGGDSFATEITNGIKNCDAFVFVLSENSDNSPHCGNELSMAFSGRKKIIPFRLHEFNLSESNTYFLQQAQWIDYFAGEDWAYSELVKQVNIALSLQSVNVAPVTIDNSRNKKIEDYISKAELELDYNNYERARVFAKQVLSEDVKNYKAYVILLLCDYKVSFLEDIKVDFSNNSNYKRALRFANNEQKAELEKILKPISNAESLICSKIEKLKKRRRRFIIWGCIFLLYWPVAVILFICAGFTKSKIKDLEKRK